MMSRRSFLSGLRSGLGLCALSLRCSAWWARLAMLAAVSEYRVCASGALRLCPNRLITVTIFSSWPWRKVIVAPSSTILLGLVRWHYNGLYHHRPYCVRSTAFYKIVLPIAIYPILFALSQNSYYKCASKGVSLVRFMAFTMVFWFQIFKLPDKIMSVKMTRMSPMIY